MRRFFLWTVAVLLLLPLVLVGGVFALLNLDVGRRLVESQAESLTGGAVRIAGLSGRFPDALRIARLELRDADGAYFTA
jgi:translocation and assembly module TamB